MQILSALFLIYIVGWIIDGLIYIFFLMAFFPAMTFRERLNARSRRYWATIEDSL